MLTESLPVIIPQTSYCKNYRGITLYWSFSPYFPIKHALSDGVGVVQILTKSDKSTAQMEHIATRLTTSWWRNGSVQVLKLPEPGADVGSDHAMVMMTFQTRLKNSRKQTQPRIRFDLEKLNEDEDGKRDLDTGSMPGSRNIPQKE